MNVGSEKRLFKISSMNTENNPPSLIGNEAEITGVRRTKLPKINPNNKANNFEDIFDLLVLNISPMINKYTANSRNTLFSEEIYYIFVIYEINIY